METGEYQTNTLFINNIASINFRIYEPSTEQSFSTVLEAENALRNEGYILSYDTTRRAIWVFHVVSKEGDNDVGLRADGILEAGGLTLHMGEQGSFEPLSLQKNKNSTNQSHPTPTSSSSNNSAADLNQRGAFASPSQASSATLLESDPKTTGAWGNESKTGQVTPGMAYEYFVAAILSSISSSFCHQAGAIPLNYRTVLIPPDRNQAFTDAAPTLGTLRSYLTTTGTLVISLNFSDCSSLSSLEDVVAAKLMPPNRPVLAAPFGVLANSQGTGISDVNIMTDGPVVQTPTTQALSFRGISDAQDSEWKQSVIRALELCGLDSFASNESSWVNLLVAGKKSQDVKNDGKRPHVTMPWPGPLCFRKRPVGVSMTSRVGDTMLVGHEESHDPLGNARSWFILAEEREEKFSKRKAGRQATNPGEPNVGQPQKPNGQSPLALRRPSTAAAGTMYPTPPDAIQNQQPGMTSSLDGTISSPNNMPSAAAMVDIDSEVPNPNAVGDAFGEGWDVPHEPKRDRSDSNLLGGSENMFGDMSGDMFGDNDITEADFNFFDEHPDGDLDLSMSDLPPSEPDPPALDIKTEVTPQADANIAEPITQCEVDNAVFAKPELKHARSVMNEDNRAIAKVERHRPTKRESSPFDPATVFKRVRASLSMPTNDDQPPLQGLRRRSSVFEKVDFDPVLPLINKKYEQGGPFDFSKEDIVAKPKLEPGTLPETEYLKRHGRSNKKPKDRPLPTGSLTKHNPSIEPPTAQFASARLEGWPSDVDDSSLESDQDDSSYTTEDPGSPMKSSVRKANLEDDAISQATSSKDVEMTEESDQQLAVELPKLSKLAHPELSLSRFFSDPEPVPLDLALADEDFIQLAQLLTEQAATGFLEIGQSQRDIAQASLAHRKRYEMLVARNSLQSLLSAIPFSMGPARLTRLKGLLDIQDVPLLGQPNRLQPRPVPGRDPNAEQLRPSNLYQIPGPHLELRRSESKLSVLPSAVTFWESLGLAPSSGIKDIHAICIFPGWPGMADNVSTFLGRLKSVYESLKLGMVDRMQLSGDLDDGILPYEVDKISTSPDTTIAGHGSTLIESMESLRGPISDLGATGKNLVMFFVYSPENPGSIIEACTAFQHFFGLYRKILSTKREAPQNELVLQLVSADFLSSSTAIVIPTPAVFVRFCMEVYDRCTTFDGPMPAPAVMLEQPLPRIIDFKLTNSPSASLMHENSCIHVGYVQSVDERWVTVAWTDNRGHQQATASYCMGRKGKPQSTSMNEVAHEIWESTLDLISIWKVHWRIIITKSGPMDQQEKDFWIDLARTESKASVTMILMTVDTNPSLQLIPPCARVPQTTVSTFYSTPVSTPQANIVSPEQSGTPATPMRDTNAPVGTPGAESTGEADSESFLVDITDQTWGAVSGHRLSNSASLYDMRPALASGYLIKRVSNKIEDPPSLMEVNLIHTEVTPRAYEPLLREMLSYFRSLGTLARARGVVDRDVDVRPWHIAAAEKGVRALYLLI